MESKSNTPNLQQMQLQRLADNIREAAQKFNEALNAAKMSGLSVQYYRQNTNAGDKLIVQEISKKVTYEAKF